MESFMAELWEIYCYSVIFLYKSSCSWKKLFLAFHLSLDSSLKFLNFLGIFSLGFLINVFLIYKKRGYNYCTPCHLASRHLSLPAPLSLRGWFGCPKVSMIWNMSEMNVNREGMLRVGALLLFYMQQKTYELRQKFYNTETEEKIKDVSIKVQSSNSISILFSFRPCWSPIINLACFYCILMALAVDISLLSLRNKTVHIALHVTNTRL